MMNPMKMKLLDELLDHLAMSQGKDFKSNLDSFKNPPAEGSPEEESMESPKEEMLEDGGKPKGLSIEKVSIMGKPKHGNPLAMNDSKDKPMMPGMDKEEGDDDEMSDDELKQMLSKYL